MNDQLNNTDTQTDTKEEQRIEGWGTCYVTFPLTLPDLSWGEVKVTFPQAGESRRDCDLEIIGYKLLLHH